MRLKEFIFALLLMALFSGCVEQQLVIAEMNGKKIPLDKATEQMADSNFKAFLAPYKASLEMKMNEVIGVASQDMTVSAPESLLSNFSADVYRQIGTEYLKSPVDIGIVNIKGLRTTIPAGEIRVSRIFELMPFENELVLVWMKGSELSDLLQFFASIGGEGVSGMKMGIKNGLATDILVGGKALDPQKVYIIATNDYLAEGNDGMKQLTRNIKRVDTGIKIRDMLIEFIRQEAAKGNKITSNMDGRITVK